MNSKILIMVAGMTAVTYIPRLLPFFFFNTEKIPKRLKRFLTAVPFAALGALLFPDSLTALGGNGMEILGAAAALLIAGVTAWFSKNILITFIVGVITAFLWMNFII